MLAVPRPWGIAEEVSAERKLGVPNGMIPVVAAAVAAVDDDVPVVGVIPAVDEPVADNGACPGRPNGKTCEVSNEGSGVCCCCSCSCCLRFSSSSSCWNCSSLRRMMSIAVRYEMSSRTAKEETENIQ